MSASTTTTTDVLAHCGMATTTTGAAAAYAVSTPTFPISSNTASPNTAIVTVTSTANPPTAADGLFPFYVERALRMQEPVEGKRSKAVYFYKGSGGYVIMDNFRNILLSTCILKPNC